MNEEYQERSGRGLINLLLIIIIIAGIAFALWKVGIFQSDEQEKSVKESALPVTTLFLLKLNGRPYSQNSNSSRLILNNFVLTSSNCKRSYQHFVKVNLLRIPLPLNPLLQLLVLLHQLLPTLPMRMQLHWRTMHMIG